MIINLKTGIKIFCDGCQEEKIYFGNPIQLLDLLIADGWIFIKKYSQGEEILIHHCKDCQ